MWGAGIWNLKSHMATAVFQNGTFKRILVDYKIENARCRSKKRWFWQATLAALNQHLDAQVALLKPSILSEVGIKTISKAA